MEIARQEDKEQKKDAQTSVYTAEDSKCERADQVIVAEYVFKDALRDFRDICKENGLDFEDRSAFFTNMVNREP